MGQTIVTDLKLSQCAISLVKTSSTVFVVMSFKDKPDLKDMYASFKAVCGSYKPPYNCYNMVEKRDIKRIFPEILKSIERSAFVIVDLSEGRPNVYYELGYAEALNKPLVITARKGSEIHFDAKDLPIIFWESQEELKAQLKLKIDEIAEGHGRIV